MRDSRLAALVLVQVQQVRLEVRTRHLQSRAPLTTENPLQEVPICQGQHTLQGGATTTAVGQEGWNGQLYNYRKVDLQRDLTLPLSVQSSENSPWKVVLSSETRMPFP